MAAGIACVTDLHHKFITQTRTDKSFICFITEIKVTNEDKLAGNRNFRKHSRKSLMCVSSHFDAFIMGSGLLHLSRYCFLLRFPKLPLSSHEYGKRLYQEPWKAEENGTKYQRILRNIRHRLGVVSLKEHSITDMQVQVNCKNLFTGCLKRWQY